jgi:hypothetical protein
MKKSINGVQKIAPNLARAKDKVLSNQPKPGRIQFFVTAEPQQQHFINILDVTFQMWM